MKKLMLLGGAQYLLPVIREAKALGLYVITCDYLPDNIAHKYADEYKNVSIIDKEAVLQAAQELEIDGIMSFACDPGVATAAYVAEKMGLSFAGSYEAVSILQNKGRFRAFLRDKGFTVPWAKSYHKAEDALADAASFTFPAIVKPTDSAGSKGVSRVDSADELEKAIRYALDFSHGGEFIVEQFIQQQGSSSDSDCFSVNGRLCFCSFDEQLFDKNAENPYTPAAYVWPSTMPAEIQAELRAELQRLMTLLELKPKYGDKITFFGNISERSFKEGKDAIEAELREKIPVAMAGGGYLYHSDHSIPSEVSLETYLHAMKVLDEVGTYS
jgi:phosphoribosylaminoimidazole carboxylase (NCAIR synthetase)